MKKILSVFLAVITLITLVSCTVTDNRSDVPPTQNTFDVTTKEKVNIKIELKDGRVMEAELYPDVAPITVQNFVDLCTSGFYDGLIFHRVESDFVIQTGDPKGNGTGGSNHTIKGEFSDNGVENNLKHAKGIISMARATAYDSASSQFFIVCGASNSSKVTSLDGRYAAFGKLTSGYDVLAEIKSVKTDSNNKPLEDVTIKYIRVVD